MRQHYEHYTSDDHERWSFLMKRSSTLLRNANMAFLEGMAHIQLSADRIPRFEEINEKLAPLTGWRYDAAAENAGIVDFMEALSKKVFLSSVDVRSWQELDFCKLPDIFHDVFGHAAMLTSPGFSRFLEELGKMCVRYKHNEEAVKCLSSVYWYTAEVGLIREGNELKYYGGSIISSSKEIDTVYMDASKKIRFDAGEVCAVPYNSYDVNSAYYVVEDLGELNASLAAIDQVLAAKVAGAPIMEQA